VGDAGAFTYKRSRRGDALVDRAAEHLLRHYHPHARVCDFEPYGYDERQYCSPGFDLPVGCLSRTPYGTYPEYHTSADNLEFLRASSLDETLQLTKQLVHLLECDRVGRNLSPKGEPQLGKRGLFRSTGGTGVDQRHMALLWVLNLSDGTRSMFEIAERSGLPFSVIDSAAKELEQVGLLDLPLERS
jgi:aminopeptidase-like protein